MNKGEGVFSVDGDAIRYGMSAIKSIGDNVVETILEARRTGGPFRDLRDFIERVSNKEANKRTIESFIDSGAFDSFGYNRHQMKEVYPKIIDEVTQEKKKATSGQISLLDFMGAEDKKAFDVVYPDVPEYDKETFLRAEKDALGLYVSGHPLDSYTDLLKKETTASTMDFYIDEETLVAEAKDGMNYRLGGVIDEITYKVTRNGENMAFVRIEDLNGSLEVVIFPRVFERCRYKLEENKAVIVEGRAQVSEKESKLIVSDIYTMEEIAKKSEAASTELWILFPNMDDFTANSKNLNQILKNYPGFSPVFVQLKEEKMMKRLTAKADASSGVSDALKLEYGADRVMTRKV